MSEKPADPDCAAGNIAVGLMRLITMPDVHDQREFGQQELSGGIAEALRYLRSPRGEKPSCRVAGCDLPRDDTSHFCATHRHEVGPPTA